MKIENWGNAYDVRMEKTKYCNGNLAIRLVCDNGEPYGDLTVNLNKELPDDMAYVDTNNMPNAERFIKENNLGVHQGKYEYSGFCAYPLYRFF